MTQLRQPPNRTPISAHSVLAIPILLALSSSIEAIPDSNTDEIWLDASGLFEMLPDGGPNASRWLRDLRINVGGWLETGLTINPAHPGDRFNGAVTFGDRYGELQLNQAYFYLERPPDQQGNNWDLGGRVDFLFGTDAAFVQAGGNPEGHWDKSLVGNNDRFYQMAIPQAYLEGVVPVGNGLIVKLGHFYTIIGNESVMAPDNFFYSHNYLMQYGEPFTQTGLLTSYSLDENFSINAGAVTGSLTGGWDGVFDHNLEEWGFLGGITWANSYTNVTVNASHGVQDNNIGDWNLYSLVLHHDISPEWHFTLQHDYGWAEHAVYGEDAQWYGIAPYLIYDVAETLSIGLRGEWFRDDEGFRVISRSRISAHPEAGGRNHLEPIPALNGEGNLAGNTYYQVTAGLNWKPKPWIIVRPNVRYDWTDQIRMFDCTGGLLPPVCTQGSQWLLSKDVILMF